jgi:hypothetical protein
LTSLKLKLTFGVDGTEVDPDAGSAEGGATSLGQVMVAERILI